MHGRSSHPRLCPGVGHDRSWFILAGSCRFRLQSFTNDLSNPVELRSHRPDRDADGSGDFLIGEATERDQQEHFSVDLGKGPKDRVDAIGLKQGVVSIGVNQLPGPMGFYLVANIVREEGTDIIVPLHMAEGFTVSNP